MSQRLNILDLEIRYETARVYLRTMRKYVRADVVKSVPREWSGREVVILLREDFEKLLDIINILLELAKKHYMYMKIGENILKIRVGSRV